MQLLYILFSYEGSESQREFHKHRTPVCRAWSGAVSGHALRQT